MTPSFTTWFTAATINCIYFICKALISFFHHSIIARQRTVFLCSLSLFPLFFNCLKSNSFLSNDKKLFLLQQYSFLFWRETFNPWNECFRPIRSSFTKNPRRIFPDKKTFFPCPTSFCITIKTFCIPAKIFWRLIKTFCKLKVAHFIEIETCWRLMKYFCSLTETFPIHKAMSCPGRKLPCSIKKHVGGLNLPTLSFQKVFISLNIPFRSGGVLFGSTSRVFVSIKHIFKKLRYIFITSRKAIDKGIKHTFQGANEIFLSTIPPQQEQNDRQFILFISEIDKMKFNPLNSESYARLCAW